MCGIFGYIGSQSPMEVCLSGLSLLEYRGYDSTGIAGIDNNQLYIFKKSGKLANLKKEIQHQNFAIAIGHTRWATHGKVNDINAHPHTNSKKSLAIVHNGIIENYQELKEQLTSEGAQFLSETDSEVIAHLIEKYYHGNFVDAVKKTLSLLKGIFAIAAIHKDHPDQIIAAANECPLAIATDSAQTQTFLSSDPNAFLEKGLNVLFLQKGEMACLYKGHVVVYKASMERIIKKIERLDSEYTAPSKEGFEHFLLKEIHEQPHTIAKAIEKEFHFESLRFTADELKDFEKIYIFGCGTSAHAGSIASLYLEDMAKIETNCFISSEARYRSLLFTPKTLIIAISQSGETADTIAAVREAKENGCKILAICNVKHSTLTREADGCIYLKAGMEVSVCSSKALTSQMAVLILFSLYIASLRGFNQTESILKELRKIPLLIQQILQQEKKIEQIAQKYSSYNDFFFMGRSYMYITCLEASLKLKEISYVNANGYPAGELKHGAIALINPEFPVIAFCSNFRTKEKILSNLMEVKARGAPIFAVAPMEMHEVASIADDVFWVPSTIDELAPFPSAVVGQLFAYYIAKIRGCDIDQPRNLAKSVTVE